MEVKHEERRLEIKRAIDQLQEIVLRLVQEFHPGGMQFRPLDSTGGDRHGGWVWTCTSRDEFGFIRFASISVTEDTQDADQILVELTAGIDSAAGSFRSEPIASFTVKSATDLIAMLPELKQKFVMALTQAATMKPENLTEAQILHAQR
jgi:hypothetical protein